MLENLADQGGIGARLIAARSARSQRIEASKSDGGAVDYDLVLTALFQNGSQHMRHPNT